MFSSLSPFPPPREAGAPPVELVVLRVSQYAAEAARHTDLLSAEESVRAREFVRGEDRERYLVAHVALRRELAARTGGDPAALALTREPCPLCGGAHGRPALAGGPHFSLTHAGDLVLLAFAAQPVGVDAEVLPEPAAAAELAGVLHPGERAELSTLPEQDRAAAFARCWTRKEAYLKGTGTGLGEDPSMSYVGTRESGPASPPGWRLADVGVPAGYAAATAVRLTRAEDPAAP